MVKPFHQRQKILIKNIVCSYDFDLSEKECLDLDKAFIELKKSLKIKFYPESTVSNLYVWFDGLCFWVSPNGKVILTGMRSWEKFGESKDILDFFWERYLKKFKVRK